ncbi:hypothetical protein PGN04_31910, partial [Klebsiella quasipneumoniae subsp. quasipneumoniae]|nr:hypothetical protein [Klebsiella quasipneumoniae subsp. quasipneumoniae]
LIQPNHQYQSYTRQCAPGNLINYSINAYIEVFDQITWGALACVGLVLMIWLYQSPKFRNRALARSSYSASTNSCCDA